MNAVNYLLMNKIVYQQIINRSAGSLKTFIERKPVYPPCFYSSY